MPRIPSMQSNEEYTTSDGKHMMPVNTYVYKKSVKGQN